MVETIDLPVLPFLDHFLHWLYVVSAFGGRSDEPLVHRVHLLQQICFQLNVLFLKLCNSFHRAPRCDLWFVTRVALASTDNGLVYGLKFLDKAMLYGQNISPGVSPCFCSLNELMGK